MFETTDILLSRIMSKHKVQGLLILEKMTNVIIQTTLDHETAISYAVIVKDFLKSAEKLASTISSTDILQFIRMKMQMYELMIVPGSEYLLIVIVST
ncbi:hypothetical protein PCK1_002072 [Pneumocystis canis]|nr:hypothetical protein PCK1_002072 [Pneumocystis canis]